MDYTGVECDSYAKKSLYIRSVFSIIMTAALFLLAGQACYADADRAEDYPKRIIIDADMGADDAAAILLAVKSKTVNIEGITVVAGNVSLEQAQKNAMMTLEVAGADIPVYPGSTKTFSGETRELFSVYGKDGMGDADLIHPQKNELQKKNAIDYMLETVAANPGEIEIVILGPATNVARAIEKDPATMKKVKRFWSMGTAGFGSGNATPVAEFNVFKDAKAYKIMLDLGVPVTIIGFDMVTAETSMDEDTLETMKEISPIHRFVALANGKLTEFRKKYLNEPNATICDALAMGAVVWPDFVTESETCHASCIDVPGETLGQVIFYRKNYTYDTMISFDSYNVEVVTGMKWGDFLSRYNDALRD